MVRPALLYDAAADNLCVGGLAQDDLRFGTLPAQHTADAGEGPPRSVSGDEVVEPFTGKVGEYLASRGVLMHHRVVGRLELAGEEPAIRVREFFGLLVHAEPLRGTRRQDHFRAEEAHEPAALNREAVSHGHDEGITLGGTDHGEPDAGVAAGCLDDGLARREVAAPLGFFDDADCKAVLHRCSGIEELRLHVDADARRRQPVDTDAWRVADRIDDAVVEAAAPLGPARIVRWHGVSFMQWCVVVTRRF